MEYKNIPEEEVNGVISAGGNEPDTTDTDKDFYISGETDNTNKELTDDDLDILELLHEYLPDYASETDEGETADSADLETAPDEVYAEPVVVDDTVDEYTEEELAGEEYTEYYGENETAPDVYSADGEEYAEEDQYASDDDISEYSYVSDDAQYETAGENNEELVVPDDTGLDATDINLMVAFGLDDELAKTMGADVAAKLAEEIDAEAKEQEEKVRRSVENEFLDHSQVPEIASSLKRRFSHIKAKTFFAAVLTILLLLYENLEMFGVQFGGALNPAVYPVIYIMGSLQIMLFCAAIGYEQILGGLAEIFSGKFGPNGIAFLGNAAAIVYSVYQAETTVLPNEPALFNACAAAMTLFALVSDYLNIKRTVLSFNIVSTKRPKYAIRYMSAAEAGIPGGLFEDDDVSEGGVLRIEKTRFVDDFFARMSDKTKSGKMYVTAYVFISVIIAVIMGVYVGLGGGNGEVSVFSAVFVTFFATLPLSLFVSMSYPFYKGVSSAYDYDGTVLGEASAEEYAEAGAVCFDDIDAFPSYGVKVQNIKIYNNHRIDRVLYYAASAFKVAGGPLSDVFEVATMEIGTSDNVEIESAAEGYLSAKVDDKHIIFGRVDKLREYGINLPDSVALEDDTLAEELCPMYMLREGKLMAKLIVRYMLDSDFEFLLKDLSEEGMCACIKTFDPNIDDNLITARLGGGRYPFRVLRYNDTDEINRISDRMSSGIVSRGTTKPLLGIIGSCSKMLGMRKAGFTVGIVSAIVAALIVWLLIASGGFVSLSSVAVVIYQLLWAVPVILAARMFLK